MELSIIVPIYNVELYLRECLDSIYSISITQKEVILVNDGSTDKSFLIAEEYALKYKDITKLINRKNGGLSAARNSGIEISSGEFLCFVDSDDKISSSLFVELFDKAKILDLDMTIGTFETFGVANPRKYLTYFDQAFKRDICSGKDFFINMFKDSTKKDLFFRAVVWDTIYKRSLFKDKQLAFEEGMLHEDELFKPQAFLNAGKVKLFDIPFYYYRQNENSITSNFSQRNRDSLIQITKELATIFEKNSINNKRLNNRLIHLYWPGMKRILSSHNTKMVTFSTLLPIIRLRVFGMKEYTKISVLLMICTLNILRKIHNHILLKF